MHSIGRQRLDSRKIEEAAQYLLGCDRRGLRARHFDPTAATTHVDAEPLFDMPQIFIHRPDEIGEPRIVDGLERKIARSYGSIH